MGATKTWESPVQNDNKTHTKSEFNSRVWHKHTTGQLIVISQFIFTIIVCKPIKIKDGVYYYTIFSIVAFVSKKSKCNNVTILVIYAKSHVGLIVLSFLY